MHPNPRAPGTDDASSGKPQSSELTDVGQEAKQQAGELAKRARQTAIQQANSQKDRAAEKLDHLGGAIERVRSNVEKQDPTVASAANIAAEQTQRLAGYLRRTDTNQILRGVEDFARRQPAVFLAGAFAVGFTLSRFLKASSSQSQGEQNSQGTRALLATGPGNEPGYERTLETSSTDVRRPQRPGVPQEQEV